jgi:uncharacterized protein (DUF1330 family)
MAASEDTRFAPFDVVVVPFPYADRLAEKRRPGGRYLARGTAAAAYEAGIKERIVISEFPSVADAIAAHDSAAYQAALTALGNGAVREIRIVEGLE